ncbi:hypothetical protein GCM10025865_26600 [Paraoerskovia sediminicola]|uniref:HTH marR-type domain-containing protein n=2 Tax=Paraoerskovia sediminicola TaxID=1138587 RepID=A0ABM8G586_9CELL|nr:hypothetical protein GCM10025865_26600 [Paraoerskovia sediminicola]
MDATGRRDLERLDRSLMRLRRFIETPAVLDDAGSPVELSTLLVLDAVTSGHDAAPTGSTIRDVAERLDVAHSTASRLVTRAEKAGAVTRGPSGADRRTSVVEATAAGRVLAERASQFRLARLGGITRTWDPRDVAALARLLDLFVDDKGSVDRR